jgi:hypothetical protein
LLRKNALNLLSILIGVAGLVTGAYFYATAREVRRPILVVAEPRIELLRSRPLSSAPIRVMTPDGRVVSSDVTLVRWYFWNAGKRSIKASDVLEPVRIILANSRSRILDSRVLKTSRALTQIDVRRDQADPDHALVIGFGILEQDDGFSAQLILEGDPATRLVVAGAIEGVWSIGSTESFGRSRRVAVSLRSLGTMILVLSASVVACVGLMFGLAKLVEWLGGRFPKLRPVGKALGLGLLVSIFAFLLFMFVYSFFSDADKRIR